MDGPAACPTDSCVNAQRSLSSGVHRRRDEHWCYERFLTSVGEQTGLDCDDSSARRWRRWPSGSRRGPARADLAEDLKEAFRGLLLRDFDALPVAHGEPLRDDGKRALREFVELPVEYPEYGPYA